MTNKTTSPEKLFRVGDIVYCLIHGKGTVIRDDDGDGFPIIVRFDNPDIEEAGYTECGRYDNCGHRVLYFSEPEIKASTTRPFVPTMIGKTVLVRKNISGLCGTFQAFQVTGETQSMLYCDYVGYSKTLYDFYLLGERVEF